MSNFLRLDYTMSGLESTLRALRNVKKANKHLRRGMTKAMRVIVKAAKQQIKSSPKSKNWKETKALEKSIGFKISVRGDHHVTGLVGPMRGYEIQIGTRVKGGKKSNKGDPIIHNPVRIAHLVEFGHAGPAPAPAEPFLRPAFESQKERVHRIIADELEVGLVIEARRGFIK